MTSGYILTIVCFILLLFYIVYKFHIYNKMLLQSIPVLEGIEAGLSEGMVMAKLPFNVPEGSEFLAFGLGSSLKKVKILREVTRTENIAVLEVEVIKVIQVIG